MTQGDPPYNEGSLWQYTLSLAMRGNQVILDILNNNRVVQKRNGGFYWLQSLNLYQLLEIKFINI